MIDFNKMFLNTREPLSNFEKIVSSLKGWKNLDKICSFREYTSIKFINWEDRTVEVYERSTDIHGNTMTEDVVVITMDEQASRLLSKEVGLSWGNISMHTHDKTEEIIKPYILMQYGILTSLIEKYNSEYMQKKEFLRVKNSLLDLQEKFQGRYKAFLPVDIFKLKQVGHKTSSQEKIKWNLAPSVLGTFFSDLLRLESETGKVIDAKLPRLVNLVIENFCDINGQDFSEATIKDYIDVKKPHKRSTKMFIELKLRNQE